MTLNQFHSCAAQKSDRSSEFARSAKFACNCVCFLAAFRVSSIMAGAGTSREAIVREQEKGNLENFLNDIPLPKDVYFEFASDAWRSINLKEFVAKAPMLFDYRIMTEIDESTWEVKISSGRSSMCPVAVSVAASKRVGRTVRERGVTSATFAAGSPTLFTW